jgi:hypothetical protein
LTFFGSISVLGNMILLTFSDFWNGGFWMEAKDSSLYIALFAGIIITLAFILFPNLKNKKIALKEEAPFLV